jgi:hypothetical protein
MTEDKEEITTDTFCRRMGIMKTEKERGDKQTLLYRLHSCLVPLDICVWKRKEMNTAVNTKNPSR